MKHDDIDIDEYEFNEQCIWILAEYYGLAGAPAAGFIDEADPYNNANQLLVVVDIVIKHSKVPFVVNTFNGWCLEAARQYVAKYGNATFMGKAMI